MALQFPPLLKVQTVRLAEDWAVAAAPAEGAGEKITASNGHLKKEIGMHLLIRWAFTAPTDHWDCHHGWNDTHNTNRHRLASEYYGGV